MSAVWTSLNLQRYLPLIQRPPDTADTIASHIAWSSITLEEIQWTTLISHLLGIVITGKYA